MLPSKIEKDFKIKLPDTIAELDVLKNKLSLFIDEIDKKKEKILNNNKINDQAYCPENFEKCEDLVVARKVILVKYINTTDEVIKKKFNSENFEFLCRTNGEIIVKFTFIKKKKLSLKSEFLKIDGAEIEILNENINSLPNWLDKLTISHRGSSNLIDHIFNQKENCIKLLKERALTMMCGRLAHLNQRVERMIPSEMSFSSLLFSEIINYFDGDLMLITHDGKINETINGTLTSFRCDMAFFIKSDLYIIETKYRSDRSGQGEEALRSILYRKYPQRLYFYLKSRNPNVVELILNVYLVGLGLNKGGVIDCVIMDIPRNIVTDESYRDNPDFLLSMKLNKRRFGKVFK